MQSSELLRQAKVGYKVFADLAQFFWSSIVFKHFFLMLVLTSLMSGIVFADTYAEKVKQIDLDCKTITILIEKKEKVIPIDSKAQFLTQVRAGRKLSIAPLKDKLSALKIGDEIVVTTELIEGVEVATKVIRSVSEVAPKKDTPMKKKQN